MYKRQQKHNNTRNHNTRYNVVHPQCRGYVHKLWFIQLATKSTVDLRTQLQIPSILKSRAHSSRPLRTQLQVFPQSFLQNPSAHTAAEVVHAHSWDLTFPYKTQSLLRLYLSYIIKPNLSSLHKRLFILRIFTKPWS